MSSDRELPDTESGPEPLFQAVNRKLQAELTATQAQRDALLAALRHMIERFGNVPPLPGIVGLHDQDAISLARAAIVAASKSDKAILIPSAG